MERGIVKWFDIRDGKRFGFIKVDDSDEEIFFHYNNGRFLRADPSSRKVVFADSPNVTHKNRVYSLHEPKQEEKVVFERGYNSQGPCAKLWCYANSYDKALEEIKNLPEPTKYRIFKSMGSIGEAGGPKDHKDAEVIWEGTDINDVMKKFPLPQSNRSPGSDPLLPYYSHDDGFEIRHWWEKQNPDGNWDQCPDQRPLSGVNRQFERITNHW